MTTQAQVGEDPLPVWIVECCCAWHDERPVRLPMALFLPNKNLLPPWLCNLQAAPAVPPAQPLLARASSSKRLLVCQAVPSAQQPATATIDWQEEAVYYDSDFECEVFVPEAPSNMRR